jgi:preflagellin peptidase FlaK
VFASIPDLLRLVAIPFFGWLAYEDIKTRRISNQVWYPLAALAVILLAWDAAVLFGGDALVWQRQRFLLGVGLSLVFVVPLVYGFWLIGGFGGADAKAFFVIALLFPTVPTYRIWELGFTGVVFPYVQSNIPAFSLTILSNAVIAGIVYPLLLALRNALSGYVSPGMFIAKPIEWRRAVEEYGTLLQFSGRSFTADLSPGGIREYFSWRGLDLDALRMYLQWRGTTLDEVRAAPERYRDPATLPAEPNSPGSGIVTDGGERADATPASGPDSEERDGADRDGDYDDPWGAAAFLDDIEGSAYGTEPEDLREGLETLTSQDVVWISPGIPFLVPLFFGLVISLIAGDVLFALLSAAGLA